MRREKLTMRVGESVGKGARSHGVLPLRAQHLPADVGEAVDRLGATETMMMTASSPPSAGAARLRPRQVEDVGGGRGGMTGGEQL